MAQKVKYLAGGLCESSACWNGIIVSLQPWSVDGEAARLAALATTVFAQAYNYDRPTYDDRVALEENARQECWNPRAGTFEAVRPGELPGRPRSPPLPHRGGGGRRTPITSVQRETHTGLPASSLMRTMNFQPKGGPHKQLFRSGDYSRPGSFQRGMHADGWSLVAEAIRRAEG